MMQTPYFFKGNEKYISRQRSYKKVNCHSTKSKMNKNIKNYRREPKRPKRKHKHHLQQEENP